MSHAGARIPGSGGPRFGRGRKRLADERSSRKEIALMIWFVVFLALLVGFGMYLGWRSSREEGRDTSTHSRSLVSIMLRQPSVLPSRPGTASVAPWFYMAPR